MTISGAVYREGVAYSPDGAVYVQHTDGGTQANPTFTGQVKAASGTAAAPSYSFTAALGAGMYYTGNALGFSAASALQGYFAEAGGFVVNGTITASATTAVPAGGSAIARVAISSTAGLGVYVGSGVPTVSAAKGSLYLRTDGSSTSTRMYVNTDGATAWTAVTTAT